MKDGWFCKTHDEWFDEIRVKRHSVRRFAKEFCEMKFLESKLKKFDGVPKPHYRLDTDELIRQLVTFCDSNNLSLSQKVTLDRNNLQLSMEGDNLMPSTNIDLDHRFNTEIRENAPTQEPEYSQPTITSQQSPPPDSAPPPSPKRSRFAAPNLEEIICYMEDLAADPKWLPRFVANPDETGIRVHSYYESNGWKVGRNQMKDWKAACRNWLLNNEKYGGKKNVPGAPARIVSEDTHRRALAITLSELGITGQ